MKPEAKAELWYWGTFNAIIWATIFECFIDHRNPPFWAGVVALVGAHWVGSRVSRQVLKEERAKANEYRS